MPETAKHTPTPWRICDGAILSDKINTYGNFHVVKMLQRNKEDIANAEYICLACNSHADLLEAAKEICVAFSHADPEETRQYYEHQYDGYNHDAPNAPRLTGELIRQAALVHLRTAITAAKPKGE